MKKSVLVVFGGQSSEHIVSCMSAINVIKNIDTERYDVTLIGITEEGKWLLVDSVEQIEDESWRRTRRRPRSRFPEIGERESVIVLKDGKAEMIRIDVVFPVLHGLWGGQHTGHCRAGPSPKNRSYVECSVLLASAFRWISASKQIVDPQARRRRHMVIRKELEKMDEVVARIENRFAYPVFIKPSNAGSSRGVSKASDREELIAGLKEAAHHDRKILVEETIVGREIECAVFGNGTEPVIASGVGAILAAADFYDFDAKYYNAESRTVVNPELPGDATERVRQAARRIFKAVDGYGLSRVDFFVTKDGEVIFNEINTMPGFTAISMYPMLFEAAGIPKPEMVTKLIEHGLKRYEA